MRPTLILIITVFSVAALYAPQPLLPVFAEEFMVGKTSSALLVSFTLAPLALAPLCYGYLLESFSSVRIIRYSILLLALTQVAFALCWSFPILLIIRVVEGFAIPAILTAMMTSISTNTPSGKLQRMMSLYIASTITGGFLGRVSSGVFASIWGWRPFFVILGSVLGVCFLSIRNVKDPQKVLAEKPGIKSLWETFKDRRYRGPFVITFCSFFVLASVMNFIPFRLVQIDPDVSELLFGLVYMGYMAGVFSALMTGKIKVYFSSDENAIAAGLATIGLSLLLLLYGNITTVLLTLFLLSAAMFFVHTLAANMVNQLAIKNKGIVNGLYVSFYYAGGTIGSYLPGLVYEHFDWPFFIASLFILVFLGLYSAQMLKSIDKS